MLTMPGSPFDRMLRRCVDRFGVDAVYIRDGDETPVKGIFDNDYEAVTLDGDGLPVSSRRTQLGIHADAIPFSPKRGDRVLIGKEEYSIADYEPDSEFGITLILRK